MNDVLVAYKEFVEAMNNLRLAVDELEQAIDYVGGVKDEVK